MRLLSSAVGCEPAGYRSRFLNPNDDRDNPEPKAIATESPHDRVIPTRRIADPGRARLPELLTIVVLVVGAGAAVFWTDYEAKRARKESEARLQEIIATQAERIASLERDMSTVKDAFGQLKEVLPAAFKAIGERLNASSRLSDQAPSQIRSSESEARGSRQPPTRQPATARNPTENFFIQATRPASIPRSLDEITPPGAIESLQDPHIRKAAQLGAEGARELHNELFNDFTDKRLDDEKDIYSKGFKDN